MSDIQTINEMLSVLQKQRDSESTQKAKAFERLLSEISTALADVVGLMEREPKKDADGPRYDFARLEEAIKGLRIEAPEIKFAPQVSVAQPTIDLKPQFNVPSAPAPAVNVTAAPAQVHVVSDNSDVVFDVQITSDRAGIPRSMHITRTKVSKP
jgi:hypothetical protein